MSTYFELVIFEVPRDQEDIVTELCFGSGAAGTEEILSFNQPDLRYEGVVNVTPKFDLKVFFEQIPSEEFWSKLNAYLPQIKTQWLEKPNLDWMTEWKKGYKSFHLAGPFWVVPSWLPAPAEAKQILFIDPGMAFGTGTHATTQMAARVLSYLLQKQTTIKSLIDVGCGTGILTMLAYRSGVKRCLGTDIDPEAIRVAKENSEKNNLPDLLWTSQDVAKISETFDVVVANIIDGILIQLRSDLVARLKPDGHMVVSGILDTRENEFLHNFVAASGLKVIERQHQDEWLCYLLKSSGE